MIIAGTGHRPQFCPCGFNENHSWCQDLKSRIVMELVAKECTEVISGAALGFDTWLAECALELGIKTHLYIPFKSQGEKWPTQSRKRYEKLKERCEYIYTSDGYTKEAFFTRDRAMIDGCDEVFSLLDPNKTSGGTYYTVQYAKEKNKPITNLWS